MIKRRCCRHKYLAVGWRYLIIYAGHRVAARPPRRSRAGVGTPALYGLRRWRAAGRFRRFASRRERQATSPARHSYSRLIFPPALIFTPHDRHRLITRFRHETIPYRHAFDYKMLPQAAVGRRAFQRSHFSPRRDVRHVPLPSSSF